MSANATPDDLRASLQRAIQVLEEQSKKPMMLEPEPEMCMVPPDVFKYYQENRKPDDTWPQFLLRCYEGVYDAWDKSGEAP